MLKNFFISSSFLLSVFFLSTTASFSQEIIGSVKNLYMIAELPIPNSDRPYKLFTKRFANTPIKIRQISRLVKSKDAKNTIEEVNRNE